MRELEHSRGRDTSVDPGGVGTAHPLKRSEMESRDIPYLSVAELAGLIKGREVSPVEAVEAYLARIDDLDFKFNSYLTVCRAQALEAARQAEGDIARGGYLGPMHGIPVAVKDQFWSKGIRTTGGSRILADFVPDEDATVIANLKSAGAIVLGKANLTEFAIGLPQRFSTVRNPWDLDMLTGASSSGCGAATAAFLCATSLGEDTGGSIRFPASWCGLVGHKPSWGRVSRYGVMRGVWSMDTVGPMSRSVEDAAITLGAIAGHDPKDPHSWSSPVPNYAQALEGEIKGMRIGIIREMLSDEVVQPETLDAVSKAYSVLEEQGATVEEVSIPLARPATAIMFVHLLAEAALDHRGWVRERLHDYGHGNRIGLLTGSVLPAHAYYKAQKLRSLVCRQIDQALKTYDVLALPTMGMPAQPIDRVSGPSVLVLTYMLTQIFNLTGGPAITVPCGLTSQGLPIGLQIGGRLGEDGTVLKVAHAYERSTPWHSMRPPHA